MRDFDSSVLLHGARKMMLQATKLYNWQADPALTLQFTNYDGSPFYFDIFLISSCRSALLSHFETRDNPLLMADHIGFTWIAAAKKEGGSVAEYHLLGPFFTVEATEQYLIRLCSKLQLSPELSQQLRRQMKEIPTIAMQVALHYAVMLQYYAANREVTIDEISWLNQATMPEFDEPWNVTGQHNSWEAEQALFQAIQDGTLNLNDSSLTATFSGSTIGTLCPWDPLRQAKDELLVLAVLASRAAILGGVSPEGGYSIADYYFQRIEAAESIGSVQNCAVELLQTVTTRVRRCKEQQNRPTAIRRCMDYIQTHIFEKIQLEKMAKELGYAAYYLSKRFKAETGISLNDYIKEQKVEQAKLLLSKTGASIAEISDRLCFSSPSYFCAVFKQHTGMAPSEYQNQPPTN